MLPIEAPRVLEMNNLYIGARRLCLLGQEDAGPFAFLVQEQDLNYAPNLVVAKNAA